MGNALELLSMVLYSPTLLNKLKFFFFFFCFSPSSIKIKKSTVDLSWMEGVQNILEFFSDRTPGSFVQYKEASLTWHYMDTDPEFGIVQAKELQMHLEQILATSNAEVEFVN